MEVKLYCLHFSIVIFLPYNDVKIVTSPKFTCLTPQKVETKSIGVWNKERLIDREGTNKEDGSPNSQIHLNKVRSSGFLNVN